MENLSGVKKANIYGILFETEHIAENFRMLDYRKDISKKATTRLISGSSQILHPPPTYQAYDHQ